MSGPGGQVSIAHASPTVGSASHTPAMQNQAWPASVKVHLDLSGFFAGLGASAASAGGSVNSKKTIDGDQAATASGVVGQGAAIGAEIIDGPPAAPAARGRGPAPAARDHFGGQRRGGIGGGAFGSVGAGADDFQPVGDADRIEGREIGHAFGKVERDAGFAKVADQLCDLGAAIGFVAHGGRVAGSGG